MARDSRIEWTHHTFNPWWGCVKVSPACEHCYAETFARRLGAPLWGRSASRRFFGSDYWRQPILWDRDAQRAGERRRVFCASMADLFEARFDLHEWRDKLWPLIEATPNLDWLLLTKRPQNISRMVPWHESWPRNVWMGTTAENQKYADLRIPRLLELPAKVRFISAEPLLGPLTLSKWAPIDWVIAGGESGRGARPTNPAWARSLRDECKSAGVAFHFKQWGHWAPSIPAGKRARQQVVLGPEPDRKSTLFGLGKAAAGRLLDGRTWDEFPQVTPENQ